MWLVRDNGRPQRELALHLLSKPEQQSHKLALNWLSHLTLLGLMTFTAYRCEPYANVGTCTLNIYKFKKKSLAPNEVTKDFYKFIPITLLLTDIT